MVESWHAGKLVLCACGEKKNNRGKKIRTTGKPVTFTKLSVIFVF